MLPPHPKLGGHLHLLLRQQLPHVKISTMAWLSSQARNHEKKKGETRDLAEEYLVSKILLLNHFFSGCDIIYHLAS
jgi:hypothetical protein